MKTTKKLIVACLALVLTMVAAMPSTFSWYAHNGTTDYQGNELDYRPASDYEFVGDGTTTEFTVGSTVTAVQSLTVTKNNTTTSPSFTFNSPTITFESAPAANSKIVARCIHSVPLSLNQSGGLSMTTYMADKNSKQGSEVTSFGASSVAAGKTQRYITKIKNNGTKPVSLDLEMSGITNNSKVSVGVVSPVINEKSYASRAAVNKVDWDYEVIYFEPRDHYSWWQNYSAPTNAYGGGVSYDLNITGADGKIHNVTGDNDMNLQCNIGSDYHYLPMQKCPNGDTVENVGTYDVYRAFVTTEADNLFFFNHYYIDENTNKEWNRTPTVSDFAEGRVYYLNGEVNSYSNKDLSYYDNFNETNICVYYYYNTATMSVGKTADISLTKGTSDDIANGNSFDYTGASISYSSLDSTIATVSQDGLITAKNAGSTTVTTTITGQFGDTLTLDTEVNIPETISQVPIAQNVTIGADEEAEIVWYVKNDSASAAGFQNIFCTI